ncbi:hypothetical protein, partial [Xenorhabdus bovienii]|uniref:hypothetical protein n=1 Tax=Xenorhabdus bovienii TaxID=40576 RepID=UPI0023B2A9CD
NVQLGDQALSVSGLSLRSTQGAKNFFNHNFRVVIATPVPIIGKAYLLLAVTSHMLAVDVACANVGHHSRNNVCPCIISCQHI